MLLEVNNLKTHFRTGDGGVARAVDGISFTLDTGRTLAIVGESGCGKSQTAFSIMRLVEQNGFHAPESQILFDGNDLLKQSEPEMEKIRGNQAAMIFQEPMASLNPLYRIGRQLAEPLILHQGMTKPQARKRAVELLAQVGIPDPASRIDNFPHEMSGGMKQRVMIAMALACRPRLLIADEPTTALDVTIQAQILSLMKDLQRETGMAILLITHDLGIVNQMADDVCVMYAGKVAEYGPRHEIFHNMQHPYTRRLLESIPAATDIRHRLHSIPGMVPAATEFKPGCRFADRCAERLEKCAAEESPAYACDPLGVRTSKSPRNACTCNGDLEVPTPREIHLAFCHLLAPGCHADRAAASARQPRPPRKTGGEVLVAVRELRTHFPVKRGLLMRTVNHVRAVDGVSLELRRGETLALVGESGCGKTTAGQSILRLVSEARGEVLYAGQNVLELPKNRLRGLRRHMQIVFQDPFASLSPRLRVGEIIGEGLTVHEPTLSAAEREKRVAEALALVGMDASTVRRYPHEFSGGQRQRVAIARALILNPDFLVLDEPTSALDVSVQAQILNLLEDIQTRLGLAYLLITHDLGIVRHISDQVAVMYLGRIVEHAPTEALFRDPRHPYTRTLLDAVPKLGEQTGFSKINGEVPSPLNPPAGCHFHPRCPRLANAPADAPWPAKCATTYPDLLADGPHHTACFAVKT